MHARPSVRPEASSERVAVSYEMDKLCAIGRNVFLSLPKPHDNALHANIALLTVSQILSSSASESLVFFINSYRQHAV